MLPAEHELQQKSRRKRHTHICTDTGGGGGFLWTVFRKAHLQFRHGALQAEGEEELKCTALHAKHALHLYQTTAQSLCRTVRAPSAVAMGQAEVCRRINSARARGKTHQTSTRRMVFHEGAFKAAPTSSELSTGMEKELTKQRERQAAEAALSKWLPTLQKLP